MAPEDPHPPNFTLRGSRKFCVTRAARARSHATQAGPLGAVTDTVGGATQPVSGATDTVGGVTHTVGGTTGNLLGGGEKKG